MAKTAALPRTTEVDDLAGSPAPAGTSLDVAHVVGEEEKSSPRWAIPAFRNVGVPSWKRPSMISLTRETAISTSSRAYQQLGSRVGSARVFRPLAKKELHLVLQRRWWTLGQTLDLEDFSDAQTIALIMRENFRLIDRLFNQMQNVM